MFLNKKEKSRNIFESTYSISGNCPFPETLKHFINNIQHAFNQVQNEPASFGNM
jgi:hypothetical protein